MAVLTLSWPAPPLPRRSQDAFFRLLHPEAAVNNGMLGRPAALQVRGVGG